ncbi:MAG TPA: hypothetical protein VK730_13705 [Solirubrobacteraceae bacterium]|jgi:hypothetical protein|nr:hypothetical protein [Solirubrobacteraceae bacterium]
MISGLIHPLWLYRIIDWPMNTGPNGGYNFWSGIGSGSPLLGAFAAWWHHNNCTEPRCWRKGHKDPGHGHPVCRKHQDKLPA